MSAQLPEFDPNSAVFLHFKREANRKASSARAEAVEAEAKATKPTDGLFYVKGWVNNNNHFGGGTAEIRGIVPDSGANIDVPVYEVRCLNEKCGHDWSYPTKKDFMAAKKLGETEKCPECGSETAKKISDATDYESVLIKEIWHVAKEHNMNFENLDEFQVYCGPRAFDLIPDLLKFKSDGVTLRATLSTIVAENEWKMVKRFGR
ncbi:zinc ribbon domain-containing protein [Sulfuricurvum sp.]|uniref:zinc ribbon domain-containing protein n=1 Tax=Sulfuricurvum sp. TaxID=2025608 RepID=UPI003563735E